MHNFLAFKDSPIIPRRRSPSVGPARRQLNPFIAQSEAELGSAGILLGALAPRFAAAAAAAVSIGI